MAWLLLLGHSRVVAEEKVVDGGSDAIRAFKGARRPERLIKDVTTADRITCCRWNQSKAEAD